jgi:hypothetical protein
MLGYLSLPSNLEKILPSERIDAFESDQDQCSFTIQGGFTISLVFVSRSEVGVRYKSGVNSPFPFELKIDMEPLDNQCTGKLEFQGEISPFIAMMAKGPLTALFNDMGKNLVAEFR